VEANRGDFGWRAVAVHSNDGLVGSMTSFRNLSVVVARRASGVLGPDNFTVVDLDRPQATDGMVVVRVLYASVDPAMRGWVSSEPNYLSVPTGAVMRAHGVGEIVESGSSNWSPGDLVYGFFGWQEYHLAAVDQIMWKVDRAVAPLPAWLGPLGLNGLTAWLGLRRFARPKAGETLLVSTAAGGVGSVVGQLAKADGVRAVGLTSGPYKVALAVEDYGYDVAIDYRSTDDLAKSIGAAIPQGVDVYFDNVAGKISDAVFPNLNKGARITQCGTASVASWLPVPRHDLRTIHAISVGTDVIVVRGTRWGGTVS
jgi:NADPH-dependent curcumin reductase CurA